MAPRRDQDQRQPRQQQQEQRLTQATLRQHTDDNPSLLHPTGGRTPARDESRGSGDGQPAAGEDIPADMDATPADAAEGAAGGATAPLERGLSGAVLRAADEGVSVSTGLTPDAPRYSDDTVRRPPPTPALPPEDPPPGSSHAESMAEAADAAVAAVDAEAPPADASSAGTQRAGAGEGAGAQGPETMTAAERAADEGVSVSTGLGDGASMATDTTFRRGGATSGRPSFETSLATVSEAGAAGQAARAGVSVSTGLDGAASVASDTTMQSAGPTSEIDRSGHALGCSEHRLSAASTNTQYGASQLTREHVQQCCWLDASTVIWCRWRQVV